MGDFDSQLEMKNCACIFGIRWMYVPVKESLLGVKSPGI